MTKREQLKLRKRIEGVTMPIRRRRIKWGRNFPCLCGSKKKYKNCCMAEMDDFTVFDGNADVTRLPDDIEKMINERQGALKEK